MSPLELQEYNGTILNRYNRLFELFEDVEPASDLIESVDQRTDGYTEALFLRAYTAYEADVENLFLHYVTGGTSLDGIPAKSFLHTSDIQRARQIIRAGFAFVSWSKPADIKNKANTYIEDGWPFIDVLATREQVLADCERTRNWVAHASAEARTQFRVVQRNYLDTERLFDLTAGQFLRIRNRRLRKLHIVHFVESLSALTTAILQPPA